jgi:hypothetical protein
MEGDTMIYPSTPRSDVHATPLVEDLRGMNLAVGETPAGYLIIPPSAAAPQVGAR